MVIVGTELRSVSSGGPNKLSYNGVFRVDSSVWRDVMSWDGGRSRDCQVS